jgi:hypothetical protein
MTHFSAQLPICILQFAFCNTLWIPGDTPTPEQRALSYLAREVPRWSVENKCFSCHNNGDAARALYTARRLGFFVPDKALGDTTRWLARPGQWDQNGDPKISDKKLARLQFAAALIEAGEARVLSDKPARTQVARLLAADQRPDGSWAIDAEGTIGSPVTYGTALATHLARRTLQRADAEGQRAAITRADVWFRRLRVQTVLDAAATLLALEGNDDAVTDQRKQCLDILRRGQSDDGGWGPYVTSASEPFDTAVCVLALAGLKDPESRTMVSRGRAYLMAKQQQDGSWPETTRPAGRESYAQRLSTSGWCTLALLATAKK